MNNAIPFPAHAALTYKPSVFYFRKDLHESKDRQEAVKAAVTVCAEFELLRDWSAQHGVLPQTNVHTTADMLRRAIRESGSHGQVILLGLFVCHELEELKRIVREAGFIPPKWFVSPSEAKEKGWEMAEDCAVNL